MNKKNEKPKIVAAMSGGVDSSVAAYLYKEKGYDVIGVTLRMKSCDDERETAKSCCGLEENKQVVLVAEKLGIEHNFLEEMSLFSEKVVDYTWKEYLSGKTPNPCVKCNRFLKFGALLDYAKQIGAVGIVTGHYAVLKRDSAGHVIMYKAKDDNKNQTYFLSALTQDQLDHSYMPLGEMCKPDVRKLADKLGLPNAKKVESQDACFGYKGETFAETLARINNYSGKPGNIIGDDGKVLGKHNGIYNFTIGQRKGLGVALGKPAYVYKIDAVTNEVYISTDSSKLFCAKFTAVNMNWLDFNYERFEGYIQTRYRQKPIMATVVKTGERTARVELQDPARAVTPGQALAVYNGDQLIAGGWIDKIIE